MGLFGRFLSGGGGCCWGFVSQIAHRDHSRRSDRRSVGALGFVRAASGDLYFLLIQENRGPTRDWAGVAWNRLPYEPMVECGVRDGDGARRKGFIRGKIQIADVCHRRLRSSHFRWGRGVRLWWGADLKFEIIKP